LIALTFVSIKPFERSAHVMMHSWIKPQNGAGIYDWGTLPRPFFSSFYSQSNSDLPSYENKKKKFSRRIYLFWHVF
jgi:hypothetical protein